MAGPWASVLEKLNLQGTQTGLKASGAAEQLTAQMEQDCLTARKLLSGL